MHAGPGTEGDALLKLPDAAKAYHTQRPLSVLCEVRGYLVQKAGALFCWSDIVSSLSKGSPG